MREEGKGPLGGVAAGRGKNAGTIPFWALSVHVAKSSKIAEPRGGKGDS